jgi:uncharacterized protein YjbI with pentapeptide repeats
MRLPGTPRSLAEMDFVAGMRPCEGCGDRQLLAWRTGGSGSRWTVRATCPRCSTVREYEFECADDLVDARPPHGELGGREPSRVVDPGALVQEIDRLVPAIVGEPGRLTGAEWERNYDRVERVLVALAELGKFIPDGEANVPASAHSDPDSAGDARARPERYSRRWIDETRAHWREVAARLAREAAGIAGPPRAPARGFLDRAAIADHGEWLARGRLGAGRLDVFELDHAGLILPPAELSRARLEAVRAPDAWLERIRLDDAELIDVALIRANLTSSAFARAALTRCQLDGSWLGHAVLERARLAQCSFAGAHLEGTSWTGAIVEDTSFARADLSDARLAGARLVRCDLRGARLVRCDLAGAELVACKVAGARGTPAAIDDWLVVDADFSEAGDGSDLGDADDLLDAIYDA